MSVTWILAVLTIIATRVSSLPHNLDTFLSHDRTNVLQFDRGSSRKTPASYVGKDAHLLRDTLPVELNPNVTYIPPPKTGQTGALLNQSLAYQPNNTATIISVMPHFQQGILSFTIQLNGFVAASLIVNASSSLPCDTIGLSPEPDLVILPQVQQGANASAVISDCDIIAVNMYNPEVVNYWVQTADGSIFALAGSNKVQALDKINTSASIAMVVRAATAQNWNGGLAARERGKQTLAAALQKGQLLSRRAVTNANMHNAAMSAQACQAIQCTQNGGKPAVYNPFTRVCGCKDPAQVEIDYIGGR